MEFERERAGIAYGDSEEFRRCDVKWCWGFGFVLCEDEYDVMF